MITQARSTPRPSRFDMDRCDRLRSASVKVTAVDETRPPSRLVSPIPRLVPTIWMSTYPMNDSPEMKTTIRPTLYGLTAFQGLGP